jgi:hypothetical protein
MPALLLKLIPFRDYVYAALAIAALIFGVHEYRAIEAKGAAHEIAAVQAASVKAQAAAKAANDKLTADYSAALVTVGENYAKAIQDNDTAHSADLKRLQQRAAGGDRADAAVGSASPATATAGGGNQGAAGLGKVPADLALELADALRQDDAALQQCYADRDSLTGK